MNGDGGTAQHVAARSSANRPRHPAELAHAFLGRGRRIGRGTSSHLGASPHDADQEPGHRWLRALYLLEHRRSPTARDDSLTRDACAFIRAWRRCRDDAQRQQLARARPTLAEVHRFYQTASPRQRAEVEARLLGRQDDETIAGLCGLSPAAVYLYHELCFHVRPYLHAEFYICDKAIGRKAFYGVKADDHDILLKLAGYGLGAVAVDQLLAYWADPPVWPVALEHLDGPALETLQSKLQMQAWLLSLTMPASAATAARIPALRSLLAQAGVLGTATAGQESLSLPAIQADLDSLASLAASKTVEINSSTPLGSEETCIHEQGGVVIPCTRDCLAVPA